MRHNAGGQAALVSWTRGHCTFTAAGVRHYEAACAEVHLVFAPQAIHTARDFCRFIRALLQASRAPGTPAGGALQLRSLARRALDEVALSAGAHLRPDLPFAAQPAPDAGRPQQHGARADRAQPDAHACAAE